MIWLGERRGFLSDWVTQQWVRTTGRRVNVHDDAWLSGPAGKTRLIGKEFFAAYARDNNLDIVESGSRGLIEDFSLLSEDSNDLTRVAAPIRQFYEHTSDYELDAWSQWHGFFRPRQFLPRPKEPREVDTVAQKDWRKVLREWGTHKFRQACPPSAIRRHKPRSGDRRNDQTAGLINFGGGIQ